MVNAKVIQCSARAFPPGPRGYPLVGILPQVLRNPLETLTNAARQYGGVVYLGSYRLRLAPGARIDPKPLMTIQPRNGVPMTLHARKSR